MKGNSSTRRTSMMIKDHDRGVRLEVLVEGAGENVLLLPSAMRGAEDFAHLQSALADDGFRSTAVNLRGAAASSSPGPNVMLRDLADDVAFVVRSLGADRAHVVGHAFGNIVARATATYHPEVTSTVTVMPCGGHNLDAYPVSEEVLTAFVRCHDESLPEEQRLEALSVAFFAVGNDARSWLDGWYPQSRFPAALAGTDPEEWWRGGDVPMLIVQPLEDPMAPPGVGRDAAAAIGDRATYVEVPRCGHAILPEQPELIAAHIKGFLRAHPHMRPGGPEPSVGA
jgi:pimeloyl-ACP methyl ester carboxylesterase